jgi:iron complex transport system substrate-binding protein
MKSLWIAAVAAVISSAAMAQDTRTVEGMFGPVELPANPQRIVVESPMILGDMVALGVKPIASGVYTETDLSYLGSAVEGVEQLPFGDGGIDIERVTALKPDLIIAYGGAYGDAWGQEGCARFAAVAPTYCFTLDYVTASTSGDNLRLLAAALGLEAKADEVLAAYAAKVDAVKAAAAAKGVQDTSVAVLRVLPDKYAYRYGMEGSALRETGFTFPAGQETPDKDSFHIDLALENLDEVQQDVIFLSVDAGTEGQLEALKANPLHATLPAVKAGRVYEVPTAVYNSADFVAANVRLDDVQKYMVDAAP